MIWVDWILLAALLVSVVIGIFRGFTREILGLVTWILSITVALLLGPWVAPFLEGTIVTPSLRVAAAYAFVFGTALVLGALITAVVVKLVRQSPLSGLDRAVGGGFGFVRGVLLAVVAVWLVGLTPARQDPWWGKSQLIPRVQVVSHAFQRVLPWRVPGLGS